MSRFNALFPFLPSSQRIVRSMRISVEEIPDDLIRAAEQRFTQIIRKKAGPEILGNHIKEVLLYPLLRLMASAAGSEYYADLLARYYADRTVYYTFREGIADFFVEVGMYVDPARPVFPLHRFMGFPHIYPEVKLYHLPVKAGNVYVPASRLPYVAGCIAYSLVRKNLPVEGEIPQNIKEAVSRALKKAVSGEKRRRKRGQKISFIEKLLSASGLPDGRKRILLYWLIPYWVTVEGLPPEEAFQRAKEWISKQAGGKILDSWIRDDIDNVGKKGIRPWSLRKVEKEAPDLIKLLRDLGVL